MITQLSLSQITSMTEDDARDYIESVLWPNGPQYVLIVEVLNLGK
jgi:hypothetical protein